MILHPWETLKAMRGLLPTAHLIGTVSRWLLESTGLPLSNTIRKPAYFDRCMAVLTTVEQVYGHPTANDKIDNGGPSSAYRRRKTSRKMRNVRTSPYDAATIYPTSVSEAQLQTVAAISSSLYFKFYVVGVDGSGLPNMTDVRGETEWYNCTPPIGTVSWELEGQIDSSGSFVSEFPFQSVSGIANEEYFFIVIEMYWNGAEGTETLHTRGASYTNTDNLHTASGYPYHDIFYEGVWDSWNQGADDYTWDIAFHHTTDNTPVFPEPAENYEVSAYIGSCFDGRVLNAATLSGKKFVERPLDQLLANVADGTAFAYALGTDEIPFAVVDHGLSGKSDKDHTHTATDVTDMTASITAHTDVAANTAVRHTSGTDAKLDEGGANEVSASELRAHVDSTDTHREIDDAASGTTDLWSAQKISGELVEKRNLRLAWLEKTAANDQDVLAVSECEGKCLRVDTSSSNLTLYLPSVASEEDALEVSVLSKGANTLTLSRRQHSGIVVAGVGTDWLTFTQSSLTSDDGDFADGSLTGFSDDTDPSTATISAAGLEASDVSGDTSATTKEYWKATVSSSWTHAPDVAATFRNSRKRYHRRFGDQSFFTKRGRYAQVPPQFKNLGNDRVTKKGKRHGTQLSSLSTGNPDG